MKYLLPTIFAALVLTSCNSSENQNSTTADTSKTVLINQSVSSHKSEVPKTKPIEQESNLAAPTTFLGLKLGTSMESFLQSYPDARDGSFWVVITEIKATNMTVLTIEKSTSSGDQVTIDCCFRNNKLAIISIQYNEYQSEGEILTGLKSKYGNFSSRKSYNWNDFTNQQDRTTRVTRWTQSTCCILELDYCVEIGITELIFADKAVQNLLNKRKEIENKSKIE